MPRFVSCLGFLGDLGCLGFLVYLGCLAARADGQERVPPGKPLERALLGVSKSAYLIRSIVPAGLPTHVVRLEAESYLAVKW